MAKKKDWLTLTHKEKMQHLATKSMPELLKEFHSVGLSEKAFQDQLERDIQLWDPSNIREVNEIDKVPTKNVVLGAWRDLDRAEAIMELIDNSIDAWNARKRNHPKKHHKKLSISIEIDTENSQLVYEDNAGGVPIDKLPNLIIPGYSDTDDLSRTIGSYRTGGKKAVFRLASAARILTHFWDPSESSSETVAVQLDQEWIEDSQKYAFPFARIKTGAGISKGSTRYVLQLRKEDVDPNPWYEMPAQLGKVRRQITNAYTLLLIRNPEITILFREEAIKPNEELYDFSGASGEGRDIRPQQITFKTSMDYKGENQEFEIELVLGCRMTTGVKDGKTGGIDLYGNDRLFVSHDQDIFADLLPTGNSRNLVRGFINIKAPNVFVPWDTHKRHLNTDREIVRHLTKSRLIILVFENWKKAYRAIGRLGSGEVSAFIGAKLAPVRDTKRKDLNLPHRYEMTLDFGLVRGVSLPEDMYVPVVPVESRDQDTRKVTLMLTIDEARAVMAYYERSGEPTQEVIKDLGDAIKEELMEWVTGIRHE